MQTLKYNYVLFLPLPEESSVDSFLFFLTVTPSLIPDYKKRKHPRFVHSCRILGVVSPFFGFTAILFIYLSFYLPSSHKEMCFL